MENKNKTQKDSKNNLLKNNKKHFIVLVGILTTLGILTTYFGVFHSQYLDDCKALLTTNETEVATESADANVDTDTLAEEQIVSEENQGDTNLDNNEAESGENQDAIVETSSADQVAGNVLDASGIGDIIESDLVSSIDSEKTEENIIIDKAVDSGESKNSNPNTVDNAEKEGASANNIAPTNLLQSEGGYERSCGDRDDDSITRLLMSNRPPSDENKKYLCSSGYPNSYGYVKNGLRWRCFAQIDDALGIDCIKCPEGYVYLEEGVNGDRECVSTYPYPPTLESVTPSVINTEPGLVQGDDGATDISVSIYSDSSLNNFLDSDPSGDFSGLNSNTVYYLTTTAQVQSGDIESSYLEVRTLFGECGSLDGTSQTFLTEDTPGLCSEYGSGIVYNFRFDRNAGKWLWGCDYDGGVTECSADYRNIYGGYGECGDLAGEGPSITISPDTPGLCKEGVLLEDKPPVFDEDTNKWTWECYGEMLDGDYCEYLVEPPCPNSILNLEEGEQCDDGNTDSGDGCSQSCLLLDVNGRMVPDKQSIKLSEDASFLIIKSDWARFEKIDFGDGVVTYNPDFIQVENPELRGDLMNKSGESVYSIKHKYDTPGVKTISLYLQNKYLQLNPSAQIDGELPSIRINTNLLVGQCGTLDGQDLYDISAYTGASLSEDAKKMLCTFSDWIRSPKLNTETNKLEWECSSGDVGNTSCSANKIDEIVDICDETNWKPEVSQSEICIGDTAQQTNECGDDRTINGTKDCSEDGECAYSQEDSRVELLDPSNPSDLSSLCASGKVNEETFHYDELTNTYTWECEGINGGDDAVSTCYAKKIIKGTCGDAYGVAIKNIPSEDLCIPVDPSVIVKSSSSLDGSLIWQWECRGVNGGEDSVCTAPKLLDVSDKPSSGGSSGGFRFWKMQCGDGELNEDYEECDDGNNISGDGCSESCNIEEVCGDGNLDKINASGIKEKCDDGNKINGDGCDNNCELSTPYGSFESDKDVLLKGELVTFSAEKPIWGKYKNIEYGDGNIKNSPEFDNKYSYNTEGEKKVVLKIENNYKGEIYGERPVYNLELLIDVGNFKGSARDFTVMQICGNGIMEEGEECDDGNYNNNDRCSNVCTVNNTVTPPERKSMPLVQTGPGLIMVIISSILGFVIMRRKKIFGI